MNAIITCWRCDKLTTLTDELRCRRCNLDLSDQPGAKIMSDEKFTLFWRGPLSQWSPSKFTVDGEEYHNAEQYMMAEKSRLFGDKEMERKIMATSSPREAKDFGRRVKDFVNHKWQAVARDIVYKGNMAKFTQSKKIHKTALMETVGTTLVEASPTDKIWGIAITEDKPEAHDRKRWKGKNWLGEVLTKVRDDIEAGVESTEFNWS